MSEAKWEMTSQYLLRLENLLSARGTRTATACWIAAVASVSDKNRFQIRKYVHKIFCRFHLYRGGWEGPLKRSGAGCVLYVSTFIFPLDRSQHFLNFRCLRDNRLQGYVEYVRGEDKNNQSIQARDGCPHLFCNKYSHLIPGKITNVALCCTK